MYRRDALCSVSHSFSMQLCCPIVRPCHYSSRPRLFYSLQLRYRLFQQYLRRALEVSSVDSGSAQPTSARKPRRCWLA